MFLGVLSAGRRAQWLRGKIAAAAGSCHGFVGKRTFFVPPPAGIGRALLVAMAPTSRDKDARVGYHPVFPVKRVV